MLTRKGDDETPWDWLELPGPPESWSWGMTAHLMVGSLTYTASAPAQR
jgi:hypothetical protein